MPSGDAGHQSSAARISSNLLDEIDSLHNSTVLPAARGGLDEGAFAVASRRRHLLPVAANAIHNQATLVRSVAGHIIICTADEIDLESHAESPAGISLRQQFVSLHFVASD